MDYISVCPSERLFKMFRPSLLMILNLQGVIGRLKVTNEADYVHMKIRPKKNIVHDHRALIILGLSALKSGVYFVVIVYFSKF